MGELQRYDIYETWTGMNIDIDQDGGEWVSYEDHSDVIQRLLQHSHSRERMNSRTIATLRAENELLVEAVIFGCTCSPTGMSGDRICKRCLWLEGRDDG